MGLTLYISWSLSFSALIFFALYIYCLNYYVLFRISFLIPSFGIPYASYTFIGISFFKLAKFSSKIVLILCSKPFVLGFVSFLYFYFFTYLVSSYYLRFLGCFFFSRRFLDLTFPLNKVSIFAIISSVPKILLHLLHSIGEACLSGSCLIS